MAVELSPYGSFVRSAYFVILFKIIKKYIKLLKTLKISNVYMERTATLNINFIHFIATSSFLIFQKYFEKVWR